MANTVAGIHLTGTHAARPAGNAVPDGTLYSCTTHSLIYQSNYAGNSWSTWASLTGTGMSDPMTTRGDIIVRDSTNTTSRLAIGAANKVLRSDGTDIGYAYPPAYQFDYAQITADVNITHTTDGTADTLITGNAVTYDGSTAVWIEVYSPRLQAPNGASAFTYVSVYEDSTLLGYVSIVRFGSASANNWAPASGRIKRTPTNASHTYTAKGVVSTGTGVFGAGAGGADYAPAWLRVTKV